MLKDGSSQLQLYSLGIVVEDKKRDSDTILVTPIEDLPLSKGLIKDQKIEFKHSLPDKNTVPQTAKIKGGVVLEAKWIPLSDGNRNTSPDVIKNETVRIFKYADTNVYYWALLFREPGIRRLETVCYMFGDLKDPLKQWDKKSSYWIEYSTHDQHVILHTSRSNGEPFEYNITIDTKEGSIEVKDDVKNRCILTSKDNTWLFESDYFKVNARKDVVMDVTDNVLATVGKKVNVKADDDIDVTSAKAMSVTTEKNIAIETSSAASLKTKEAMSFDSAASSSFKSKEDMSLESTAAVKVKAASHDIDAPTNVKQPLQALSGMGVTGGFSLNGIGLDGFLEGLQDVVQTMQATIAALQSAVDTLESTVTTLQSEVTGLTTRITDLESRLP